MVVQIKSGPGSEVSPRNWIPESGDRTSGSDTLRRVSCMNWLYFAVFVYVVLWFAVEIKEFSVYHWKGWWKKI